MNANMAGAPSTPAQAKVRKYFHDVMTSRKLPSLPIVAAKALEMIEDPDVNARKLCRVLSDDVALATRILTVSRSPSYAQRNMPTTLLGAVQVLGFRTVRSFVVANAVHSLCNEGNQVSEKLWNHSLGVALAARILCEYTGIRDRDQAFLAGLLHDVGEMILLHGDPTGFVKLGHDVEQAHCQMIDKELEVYGFDHTVIGVTLLDAWNIDSQISRAVLNHHSDLSGDRNNALAELVSIADFLCFKADLGFFGELPTPPADILAKCGCADEESVRNTCQSIREAYDEESALFRPV